jgi:hypothetical protein
MNAPNATICGDNHDKGETLTKYQPTQPPEWEDPPAQKRQNPRGSVWDPIAAQLKAHPGKWACIGRDVPTTIVSVIRQGQLKCFKPVGSFEVTTRNHTDRWRGDVYARYVGEDQEYA